MTQPDDDTTQDVVIAPKPATLGTDEQENN